MQTVFRHNPPGREVGIPPASFQDTKESMAEKKQKIGIYGGSFDPIHLAHLQVAESVFTHLKLDCLYFVPAAKSPFKGSQHIAPGKLRLEWIQLAIANHPHWFVDTYELDRGGLSYTIDTVHAYAKRYPEAQLFYLVGMDNAPQLPLWKSAEELARMVEFAIVTRPGKHGALPPAPFRCHLVGTVFSPISSHVIREKIFAGKDVTDMLPTNVCSSILASGFYQKK